MRRFTLELREWYAMELISPEFGSEIRHCSPIKIQALTPAGGGQRRFDLEFYHAAYPSGVRDKCYSLQTIKRTEYYLLASVVGTDRLALFMDLTDGWLEKNGAKSLEPARRSRPEGYEVPSGLSLKEIFGASEPESFAHLHWKAELMSEHGLPAIGYPVPHAAIKAGISGHLEIGFEELLYWLQLYTEIERVRWRDYSLAMVRLAELISGEPAKNVIAIEGEAFWLELGPVDILQSDIVTIQRDDELVGAFQPREDSTLRFSAYQPLDARAIRLITALALKPNPDGTLPMRRTNWESALAGAAGMGQVYAADNGSCYLSRWEFGLGTHTDGAKIPTWYNQGMKQAQEPSLVAVQIEVFDAFQQLLKN